MPVYRRAYTPGGTLFLTLVTHRRLPIFAEAENVARLRTALQQVMQEQPFEISAAVVLPDHLHFLWSLPRGDTNYSRRIGRLKVLFTRSLASHGAPQDDLSASRRKHRERNVWQRRFWEHTIQSEDDFSKHLDYIHYNPVKHAWVACPHLWPYSSFRHWVGHGAYPEDWGCCCDGKDSSLPPMANLENTSGE